MLCVLTDLALRVLGRDLYTWDGGLRAALYPAWLRLPAGAYYSSPNQVEIMTSKEIIRATISQNSSQIPASLKFL